MRLFGTKEIKVFVKEYLTSKIDQLKGLEVADIPAGSGISSEILFTSGCKVNAFDLFPELFIVDKIKCKYADLAESIPLAENSIDFILCQEGIEHISDQLKVFCEFSRILKKRGILTITTPNYSNLRSKVSFLLDESEYAGKLMPPNVYDSIWFTKSDNSKIYLGHIFLMNFQKLRILSELAGFKIKKVFNYRINKTSLILFPLLYPFILLMNTWSLIKINLMKNGDRKEEYKKIVRYNFSPGILLSKHLFIEFEKDVNASEMQQNLKSKYEDDTFIT